MKEYIYAEYLKEKREKHNLFGFISIAVVISMYCSNLYRMSKSGGTLDVYLTGSIPDYGEHLFIHKEKT